MTGALQAPAWEPAAAVPAPPDRAPVVRELAVLSGRVGPEPVAGEGEPVRDLRKTREEVGREPAESPGGARMAVAEGLPVLPARVSHR